MEGDAALLHRRRDGAALAGGLGDEDADRLGAGAGGDQVLDLPRHRLRLRALVAAAPEAELRLAEAMLEDDHVAAGMEIPVPGPRSAPLQSEELVRVVPREGFEQRSLSPGRLLELVDHQELEAVGELAADVGPLHEEAVEGEEDVATVEAARVGEDPVVDREQLRELKIAPRPLSLRLVGRGFLSLARPGLQGGGTDGFGLQPVDPGEQAGEQAAGVAADLVAAKGQLVEAVEQHRQALRRAEDVEERVEPGGLGVVAQDALADRVPAADPELFEGALEHRLRALAQPPRGGAGRADQQHATRCGAGRDEIAQPPGQQLGLAGSGGTEDEQGPVAVGDGAVALARFRRRRGPLLAHRPKLARHSIRQMDVLSADWPEICRRVVARQREIFAATTTSEERTVYEGVGEGGDHALAIDRRCEDVVFSELEALAAQGAAFTAVSEERGEVYFGAGGEARVVIDPIDGSLNARRTIPAHSLSIAVASGSSMADVEFGFVHDFGAEEEFSAGRGEGARLGSPARGRARRRAARGGRSRVGRARQVAAGPGGAGREGVPVARGWLDRDIDRIRRGRPLRRDAGPALVPLGRRGRGAA
ncbi:MAG: hypothetical protein U0R26_07920 [Solirubrobacterales bacterium]